MHSINTSFTLEQFWDIENSGTVRKNGPVLLTTGGKSGVSILET